MTAVFEIFRIQSRQARVINGLATGNQYDSQSPLFNKRCLCDPGWIGELCDQSKTTPCGENGENINGKCICQSNFVGDRCEYVTKCSHGQLYNGRCACYYGWAGDFCDKIICHLGSPNEANTACICPPKYRGKYCDFCAEPSSSPPPECAKVSGRHKKLEEEYFAIILIAVIPMILVIIGIVFYLRYSKSKQASTKHARQTAQDSQGTNNANDNQPLRDVGRNVVAQDDLYFGKFSDAPPPYEAVLHILKNQSMTVKVENEHDAGKGTGALPMQREGHEQGDEAHLTSSEKNLKYSSPSKLLVTFSEEAMAQSVEVNNEMDDGQLKQRDGNKSVLMNIEEEEIVCETSSDTEKILSKDKMKQLTVMEAGKKVVEDNSSNQSTTIKVENEFYYENLNDNGRDIVDIPKIQVCLKSSRKDFKRTSLVYNTMTTDAGSEVSRWLEPIDEMPPATHFLKRRGSEQTNSIQTVSDERAQSIDFPLMGAPETPHPKAYPPVLHEYDFSPQNCAILQISNYKLGHETRSNYEGDRRSFESLRRQFNVPATSKIPVISIENQTREQMLTAVRDFVKAIQALPANERIDGCAVFIVTHGKDAEINGTDGRYLRLSEISSEFSSEKCSKLANKQLLLIEACYGGWSHYAANNGTIDSSYIRALTVLREKSYRGDTTEKILRKHQLQSDQERIQESKSRRFDLESLVPENSIDEAIRISSLDGWSKIEQIGEGRYGDVWVYSTLIKETPYVAGKKLKVQLWNLNEKQKTDLKARVNNFIVELNTLYKISNVCSELFVQFIGCYLGSKNLILFTEYMENGSIKGQILNKPLNEATALKYTFQATQALNFLHHYQEGRIVHRDIKCDNLLLTRNFDVKLADFGFVHNLVVDSESYTISQSAPHGLAGTFSFAAPEVLFGGSYGRRADIW
uniref:Uncharacterized protein n=1 Tax=Plectus sambesii TaxID=2011161 RepID=A0A914XKS9_9BILA